MRHPSGVALIISSLLTVYLDVQLFLLMTILSQTLFAFVGRHFVFFPFFTARHSVLVLVPFWSVTASTWEKGES